MRSWRNALAACVLAVTFVAGPGVGTGAHLGAAPAAAATAQAVVVVDTGATVHVTTISFSGTVTGLQALTLAGAGPVTVNWGGGLGQAVCQLYGVGDQPVPGECPGGWAYWRAGGGAKSWTQSGLGVSNTTVSDGDVEGWKWGGGQPRYSLACAAVRCDPAPTTAPAPATTSPPVVGASGSGAAAPTDSGPAGSPTPAPTTAPGRTSTGGGSTTSAPGGGRADANASGGDGSGADAADADGGDPAREVRADRLEASAPAGADSGSPVGVAVAVVVVAGLVVTALRVRRRRAVAT